ncbi:MAG: putative Ig domain-containing protein, partial [Candidatus Poseidoniaceae archaeon]|nr:putative Ig domain-containing protein [Candidatus Poseidoniaceae archaeon]
MASARSANLNKSILLVILMITMTQVGYLESINPWRSGEETLDKTTDLLETGGQGSASYSLGQSTFGEAVALNAAIEPITFEYRENSDAATLYGNGSLWTVNQTSNPIGTHISPQRASTGNNSMLNDEVFFFDNGKCDISMHNTSNGTTWEAFAISPCSSSSRPFDGKSFFVSGEHFLFQLYDNYQAQQIWAYNTSNGTSWRIGGGTFSDTSGYLKSQDDLFQHGNDFWFWGYESGSRSQLYRINGSTMEVEARSNFTASCYQCTSGYVGGWAASNGSIYFVAKVTSVGMKVYFHDIATNQTSLAFDINPSGAGVFGLTQVSDNLLFLNGYNTSSSGLKLWAHNTTTNQTYLQSDIQPSHPFQIRQPLIDDVYYFYATNTSTGNELHAYSIVNNSTWLVDDIQPGSVGSRPSYSMYQVSPLLQAYEGKLFILADDGTNGDEVWVHDPSTAETYRLTNLGNDVENIQDLVGDTLYFISSKSGYCCYMYAHSMSTNSTYEVPNFPDGRYYQTGARFFLPVNGTIYMNGGHGPSSNNPIQALVAWSPSAITPMTTPVAGATCSVSSTLPSGLALNQGNCTVSGTPTVVTPQSNYTLTATINGQTYGATFWLTTDYLPMRPSVAELEASIGVAITDISFGGFGEPGDGGYGEPFNYNHQSIYAGHHGFCFILETGELRCDGLNYIEGQGPVAVVADVFVEPSLPADAVVKHVLPGSMNHVCAILVNESLYCWGGNTFGQLGNGNYNAQYTPVHIPLPTGRTVEKISADHEFSCALLDNGSIMCWGRNHEGQLGRGTTATSGQNSPGYVSILPQGRHAVDVGVGSEHVCALLDNNDVVCWGANNSMTGSSSITVPQTLSFPSNQSVLSIAAIGKASCALMDNGSVRCWGSNGWYHALGVTGASTTGTPTLTATMPGGLNATALIAHHDGVCATLENFSIACWGAIQYTHVVEPTIPSFPHGSMQITSFAASNNRACYALENGSLWCGTSSTGGGDFIDIESPIQSSLPTLISGATCSISPPLPSGLSLTQGTCKIIGTPTALASNQTYAVFANTTEGTYRGEVNIAVVGEVVDTPIVLLNNSDVDEIAPFYPVTGATYALSPDLPTSMQFDASNGSIWGTPNVTMVNSTYTMWANLTDGTSTLWAFFLEVLEDLDGDGMPDVLPGDYDGSNDPIRSPPGLVEDLDDDGDGYNDTAETDTGTYVDENNTGTDPRDPDTDDDGICDGPNAVAGVCVAGPDTTNGPNMITTPVVLVNNSEVSEIAPFITVSGATYALSPDLPTSMQFDASNGSIWGTSDMVMSNSTYTMWANLTDGTGTSWTFFLEVLEDLDGDGMPDVLPGDYDGSNDPIRSPPGLVEDLDDDGDGYNDTAETDTGLYLDGNNTGTDPRDPDTDDDGICDGPNAVSPICIAGPDLTPFGPPATVVAVNNSMIPSVPPYYAGSGLTYEVMPDLPNGLTIDANNGYLMGIPTETTGNITYTVFANLTDGTSYSWDFTIEVLEDSDGDGSPDTLPADYDGDDDSIRAPPGLTEDLDDDGDGESDLDEIENGTEPLNPDTDGDGFCDGINAVSGVCFAGPDP